MKTGKLLFQGLFILTETGDIPVSARNHNPQRLFSFYLNTGIIYFFIINTACKTPVPKGKNPPLSCNLSIFNLCIFRLNKSVSVKNNPNLNRLLRINRNVDVSRIFINCPTFAVVLSKTVTGFPVFCSFGFRLLLPADNRVEFHKNFSSDKIVIFAEKSAFIF